MGLGGGGLEWRLPPSWSPILCVGLHGLTQRCSSLCWQNSAELRSPIAEHPLLPRSLQWLLQLSLDAEVVVLAMLKRPSGVKRGAGYPR